MNDLDTRRGASHHLTHYLPIFIALVILTAAEVAVSHITGGLRTPVLLGMSLVKALLVIFYYMYLKYDTNLYISVFFIPFILTIIFLLVINQ